MKVPDNFILQPEDTSRASVNSFGIEGSKALAMIIKARALDLVHQVSPCRDVQDKFTLDEDEAPGLPLSFCLRTTLFLSDP